MTEKSHLSAFSCIPDYVFLITAFFHPMFLLPALQFVSAGSAINILISCFSGNQSGSSTLT